QGPNFRYLESPIPPGEPPGTRSGVFSSSGVPSLTIDMSLALTGSLFCCAGANPPASAATNTTRCMRESVLLMANLDFDHQAVGRGGGHHGIHRIGTLPGGFGLGDFLDFQIAAGKPLPGFHYVPDGVHVRRAGAGCQYNCR